MFPATSQRGAFSRTPSSDSCTLVPTQQEGRPPRVALSFLISHRQERRGRQQKRKEKKAKPRSFDSGLPGWKKRRGSSLAHDDACEGIFKRCGRAKQRRPRTGRLIQELFPT